MPIAENLYILHPQSTEDTEKLAQALALVLVGTQSWEPEPGVEITIHCTTSYPLAPYPIKGRVTSEVIDKARELAGRAPKRAIPDPGMCENLHPKGQRGCALCEELV